MDNKRKKVSFSGKPEVKIIESTRHEATSYLSMELTLDLTQTQNTVLINNPVPKAIEHKPATSFFNASFDDESDNNVNIGTLSEELNVDQKDVFENLLANASTVEDCDFNSPLVNDNDYKSKEISIINNLVPVKISEYEIDEQHDKSLLLTDTIAEAQLNKKEETTKLDANNTNIITTQDIEKLVKQNSVTLNEVLVANNIILHDKIFLNEQRRTSCIPLSNIKEEEYFYDVYVMRNQAEYYKKFNSFLRSDSANREERIKELEPRIYMQEKDIDFQKLKRYARDKASNEWYLMRYEKEKENVEELKKIEEVIDSFLSDENNLEQEISTIEKENKQLALEIDETKSKMIFSIEENVQDKIDIIKNYFMSQMNIKDTSDVSAEGEFVLKQLTYDELKKEGTAELVNLMESEIMTIKKRNEHFYNKKKEHELKIKDIENKIRDCEEKYKILNATKEDCEEAVKKYQLMLEMLCINLKTVSTDEIAFDFFDFHVTYRKEFIIEIRKNRCDLYDFFLGKIQQNNLRSVLYALLDLYLLNKEIKGHQIYLNEDSVEIYVGDKTVSFNLENVLVTKNEMILFSGMRKYGMIKSFLDKV